MPGENELIIKISGTAKDFIDEIDKVKKKTESLEKTLTKTAKVSAIAFAAFAATIAILTKSFATYEKALVGVGKTTNIEGKRLRKFGKEFQRLSSDIPITTNELLGIAQAAGQLGIEGEENLLKFTETIAKLGVATDLTGEQAATGLARLLGLTKEAVESVDVLGSVIVALGNSSKATESEILAMALSVAKSTGVFGVSSADAAALGTVLKELGQEAQLGGSVVGKSFLKIQQAIDDGGQSLDNLSKLTGIAGDQLKQTFEDDAVGVFRAFLSGIGNLEGGTTAIFRALDAFGLKGDEVNKILPILAKNTELLNKAFKTTAKETKNATALNEEAAKAFATLSSEGQRVLNNFENLKTNIGEKLAPAVTELLVSINGLLKSMSEVSDETLTMIAGFLKWGAIITAAATASAVFVLGLLKLKLILKALKFVFTAARLAAVGFTATLTGGLSLILAFLPEIIDGFKFLFKLLGKGGAPESLEDINRELEKMRKIREEIARAPDVGFVKKDVQLKNIQDEIDKLEELRKKRLAIENLKSTGSILFRPEADKGFEVPDIFGLKDIEQVTIPFRPEEEAEEEDKKAKAKKNASEIREILSEAQQKRIDDAKRENEVLKELREARFSEATQEEEEALIRRAEIEAQFSDARKIKNTEEKELVIENLQLQHEEELEELEAFDELKAERDAIKLEEQEALDEELRALSVDQQAQFNQEDLKIAQGKIDTQQESEKKFAKTKLDRQITERNKFKQDEIQFGTSIATLRKFFASQEVQGFSSVSGQLAQLSQSRNSKLKSIGKAAAHINAAIATSEGAIKAYTALAGIPLVGPALGVLAAGALIAFGVEQQENIARLSHGGFVPPTSGGARDRFPAFLEPGELTVPAAIAPNFIQAAGIPDTQGREAVGDQDDQGTPVLEIMLEDRAGEMISLEQREGRTLGIIGDS